MAVVDGDESARRQILLGNELEDAQEIVGALAHYRAAVTLAPHMPKAHLNLGNGLQALGKMADAIESFRAAIQLDPSYAAARFNLGLLLWKTGAHSAAEHEFGEALRLQPGMPEAGVALANTYETTGRLTEAEATLRDVLATDPGFIGAIRNLAAILAKQERADAALELLEQGLVSDPGSAELHDALGALLIRLRRPRDASAHFRKAFELLPSLWQARSRYLFSLNLRDDVTPSFVFQAHKEFGEHIARQQPRRAVRHDNVPDPDRKIRIGYVSGDLVGLHPIARLLSPILKNHDRNTVEVYCYSNAATRDGITQTLKGDVEHWRDVGDSPDNVLCDTIAKDRIDILIDLSGHTANSRLLAFAQGPAPVQATWLGYLNTTGLEAMDYRISDHDADPPGAAELLHTEKLVRLPHSQWCYAPHRSGPAEIAPRRDPSGQIVFGSFNQFGKLSDSCLDLWGEILGRLPTAVIRVYDAPAGRASRDLIASLGSRGVAASRISLFGRLGLSDYLSAIANVDIALDSFPYGGATTTLDTLWMGVPLVGLAGDRGISRGAYSILRTLGVNELLATDHADFIGCNLRIALDPARRQAIARTLRQRLENSPLMNGPLFTRQLERSYRYMWQEWCSTHPH